MSNVLGPAIKELRKSKGLTQKELSRLTGFSQNTISNHENSKRSLDEIDINKYAQALGVKPQDLFNLISSSDEDKFSFIYSQLNPDRKAIVYDFAEDQLYRQRREDKILISIPSLKDEIETIAAHSDDRNRKFSKEELQAIKDFADEEIAKFKKKNNIE